MEHDYRSSMAAKLPTPTDSDVRTVLDRQALVMFELANEVLADVTLDECLWRISDQSWTVHELNGRFVGELGDEPPDSIVGVDNVASDLVAFRSDRACSWPGDSSARVRGVARARILCRNHP